MLHLLGAFCCPEEDSAHLKATRVAIFCSRTPSGNQARPNLPRSRFGHSRQLTEVSFIAFSPGIKKACAEVEFGNKQQKASVYTEEKIFGLGTT
jgi:hypothetical protein